MQEETTPVPTEEAQEAMQAATVVAQAKTAAAQTSTAAVAATLAAVPATGGGGQTGGVLLLVLGIIRTRRQRAVRHGTTARLMASPNSSG